MNLHLQLTSVLRIGCRTISAGLLAAGLRLRIARATQIAQGSKQFNSLFLYLPRQSSPILIEVLLTEKSSLAIGQYSNLGHSDRSQVASSRSQSKSLKKVYGQQSGEGRRAEIALRLLMKCPGSILQYTVLSLQVISNSGNDYYGPAYGLGFNVWSRYRRKTWIGEDGGNPKDNMNHTVQIPCSLGLPRKYFRPIILIKMTAGLFCVKVFRINADKKT